MKQIDYISLQRKWRREDRLRAFALVAVFVAVITLLAFAVEKLAK